MDSKQLLNSILSSAYNIDDEPEDGLAVSDLQEALEVVLKHVPDSALYDFQKKALETALNHVPDGALPDIKKEIEENWAMALT